jgi:hypothetical protein
MRSFESRGGGGGGGGGSGGAAGSSLMKDQVAGFARLVLVL